MYEAIEETLRNAGVRHVFGLVGDGNVRLVSEISERGEVKYYGARHESVAVAMADGYARSTGQVGICSVTQGPGLTNTVTAIRGAKDARTPLVLIAGDTPTSLPTNYQAIDQDRVMEVAGAVVHPIRSARLAAEDVDRALRQARQLNGPVVLNMTQRVQDSESNPISDTPLHDPERLVIPNATAIAEASDLIDFASRPIIVAGLGAALDEAGPVLRDLAEQIGALLFTSVRAKGLFSGDAWDGGICGDLASQLGSELIGSADLIIAVGASMNFWTTANGELVPPGRLLIQIDSDESAIGRTQPVTYGVVGGARAASEMLLAAARERSSVPTTGYRTEVVAERLTSFAWTDEYADASTDRVDPRALVTRIEDMLPAERTISVDGGHFTGFPTSMLSVPDQRGFLFAVNFGSIGLSLGVGMGAAIGRPDRLSVVLIGDGAMMMCLGDLDTAIRYDVPLLVFVVNDAAYGAELHSMELLDLPTKESFFSDVDFAAVSQSLGGEGLTVRDVDDLAKLEPWLADPQGLMVVDCKIDPQVRATWIEEVLRPQVKARKRAQAAAEKRKST
ncbi:MAG: thiamine pyrophosphate-binding protein [Acidimicrobiales bacterium]